MQFGELPGGVIIEMTDVLEVVQEFVQMEKRSYKQQDPTVEHMELSIYSISCDRT